MLGFLARRSIFLAALAAAIGVPYLVNNAQLQEQWKSAFGSTSPSAAGPHGSDNTAHNATAPPDLVSAPDVRSLPDRLEGPEINALGDIFRFDVTPRWVTTRWSRVTTVLAEFSMEGLRVPLVTGTGLDDLAGSLTYYFDNKQQLQRITFEGQTGDERKLAAFVQQAFELEAEPSLYAGLYLKKWNGKPKSALLVRHAPVITSANPHARLQVLLELNRPNDYYELSDGFRELLGDGKKTLRWGR